MIRRHTLLATALVLLASCAPAPESEVVILQPRTPVTVAHVSRDTISTSVLLNATSQFLRKNMVRANLAGTVHHAYVALGDRVRAGQALYVIRTKEAEALGALAAQDSSFHIKGLITIKSPSDGVIVQMNKLLNDYVNDGDQLAIIAESGSSVFLVAVPYELNERVRIGDPCTIVLPDSTLVRGTIYMRLSNMDPVSQTQGYAVRPNGGPSFPEGLVGTLHLKLDEQTDAQVVPASCVVGNEEMTRFWVMRLIDDSTAIKVPITRGIVTQDEVEIMDPVFQTTDRIVRTGGYGMADTARVSITTP